MSIEFQNLKKTIKKTRPVGYKYPSGLSFSTIISAGAESAGGTKTTDGTNTVHTFTTSGIFKPAHSNTVEYLVIAGGGSGAATGGGGGGAGGFRYNSGLPVLSGTDYTITVGAGGTASPTWIARGSSGSNSSINYPTLSPYSQANSGGYIESEGGGSGGTGNFTGAPSDNRDGARGGCGGGGGGGRSDPDYYGVTNDGAAGATNSNPGGSPTTQGFAGGRGLGHAPGVPRFGGGGGGIGGAGSDGGAPSPTAGGAGGVGVEYSISGVATYYGGGGGGGPNGAAGNGGGGAGSNPVYIYAGTANRGGGGGGGHPVNPRPPSGPYEPATSLGASGGSGVVIIRYQTQEESYSIN